MLDPKKFEQFARQIHKSIPKAVQNLKFSLNQKIRRFIKNQISHMNFINKEDFDLQIQILSQMQEKLTQLEEKIKTIESNLKNLSKNSNKQ